MKELITDLIMLGAYAFGMTALIAVATIVANMIFYFIGYKPKAKWFNKLTEIFFI